MSTRTDDTTIQPARGEHSRGRKPMSDLQAIADRVEVEALLGEFTDAVMMHDYDRLASARR